MRFIIGLSKAFIILATAAVFLSHAANAQTARTFGSKPITVRLCPATCLAVNGHGLKPGSATNVFEVKSGWARVSGFLDRKKLVPGFGDKITQKPALWVPVSALATKPKVAAAKPEKKPKKKVVRRVNVIDQIARLRNIPRPNFRPGSSFTKTAAVAEPAPQPVTVADPKPEPIVEEAPKQVVVEQPKPEPKPEIEVVESKPVQRRAENGGAKAALTWEEVQAKIAAQKARIAAGQPANPEPAAPKIIVPKVAAPKVKDDTAALAEQKRLAEEAKKAEAARLETERKAAEQAKLAKEAEAKRQAELAAKKEKERKVAEAAEAARKADAAKKAETAQLEAERKAAEQAKLAKEAEAKRQAELAAKKEKERKAAEAASKAEEARKAEAKKIAAAKAAAKKPAESNAVGYNPPKAEDEKPAKVAKVEIKKKEAPKPAAPKSETKVVLPPVVSKTVRKAAKEPEAKPEQVAAVQQPVEQPKKRPAPDPVFKSAKADPIIFGARPKKLTRALLDKRLRKLPGRKSKVRRNIVIAMRHTALGLLKSGECKGIAAGGPSTTPGMFYLTCTDDPGYLRQFPIEEESW